MCCCQLSSGRGRQQLFQLMHSICLSALCFPSEQEHSELSPAAAGEQRPHPTCRINLLICCMQRNAPA